MLQTFQRRIHRADAGIDQEDWNECAKLDPSSVGERSQVNLLNKFACVGNNYFASLSIYRAVKELKGKEKVGSNIQERCVLDNV